MWALCIYKRAKGCGMHSHSGLYSMHSINNSLKWLSYCWTSSFSSLSLKTISSLAASIITSISGVFPDGAGRVATFLLSPQIQRKKSKSNHQFADTGHAGFVYKRAKGCSMHSIVCIYSTQHLVPTHTITTYLHTHAHLEICTLDCPCCTHLPDDLLW